MSRQFMEILESRQLLAAASPNISASTPRLLFSQLVGSTSRAQSLTLTNSGAAPLSIGSVALGGDDSSLFFFDRRSLPATLAPGASGTVKVAFRPRDGTVRAAFLRVSSNDPDLPRLSITLRGLGTSGRFEDSEPSLQRIVDTAQIPINVGDTNPATSSIDGPRRSEEVAMPLLQKAGPGPVRMVLQAVFSWESNPVGRFGWYEPPGPTGGSAGTDPVLHELFTSPSGSAQTLDPKISGYTKFDPGSATFGIYSIWPYQEHGAVFSQDSLNTWDTSEIDKQHKVRFYPFKRPDGTAVANAYVVGVEEAFNSDFQDAVLILDNVKQVNVPAAPAAVTATANASTGVTLRWADESDNETGFLIERSQRASGPFGTVGTAGVGASSFHDGQVRSGRRYYYRVRAVNGAGLSPAGSATAVTTGTSLSASVFEAEQATQGGVELSTKYRGYSGSGFIARFDSAGDYVDFLITAPAPGTYKVDLRYANGYAKPVPLAITVNKRTVNSGLALASTGLWSNWQTTSTMLTLSAGRNRIRLIATAPLGPNLDWLALHA